MNDLLARAIELGRTRPIEAAAIVSIVIGAVMTTFLKLLHEVRARRPVLILPVHLRKTFKGSATDLVFIPPYPTKIPVPLPSAEGKRGDVAHLSSPVLRGRQPEGPFTDVS